MAKRGSRPLVDWTSIDWKEQDIVIAEHLGVSRERVRQVRRDTSKRQPTQPRCRRHSAFSVIKELATKDSTLRQISKATGYTVGHVRNVLDSLGMAYTPEDLRVRGKYKWQKVSEAEYYQLTDKDIAKRLGIENPGVVTLRRIRKFLLKRLNSLDGMLQEDFDAMTDEQVAEKIDVKVAAVTQYRRALAHGWVKWPLQEEESKRVKA